MLMRREIYRVLCASLITTKGDAVCLGSVLHVLPRQYCNCRRLVFGSCRAVRVVAMLLRLWQTSPHHLSSSCIVLLSKKTDQGYHETMLMLAVVALRLRLPDRSGMRDRAHLSISMILRKELYPGCLLKSALLPNIAIANSTLRALLPDRTGVLTQSRR